MTIISAYKSDIGLVKSAGKNEDFIWVDENTGLFIVADGLGGLEAGDIASRLASTTIGQFIIDQIKAQTEPPKSAKIKAIMAAAIETANEAVYKTAQAAKQNRKMATTILVALVQSSAIYISHAGDSRAYLVKDSSLTQLTVDDSWKTEFGSAGQSGEARRSGIEYILTKALGQDSKVEPSFTETALVKGDHLILCSDGLWDMVSDAQILDALNNAGDNLDVAVDALVDAANAGGGKDNISVVVIKRI